MVAWSGYDSQDYEYEIFVWNGTNISQITNGDEDDIRASFHDNKIAWEKRTHGNSDIYYWDGNNISQISDHVWYEYFPSLHNGQVAYRGNGPGTGSTEYDDEIYYWDGNTTFQITNNGIHDSLPSLYDGKIAWESTSNIHFWDGNTATQITQGAGNQSPYLFDGQIVYKGWDGDEEIFYYDGETSHKVTDNKGRDLFPKINGDMIVWGHMDDPNDSGGSCDLYYATIDSVPIPSAIWLLAPGLIGLIGFRRKFRKA